METIEIARRMAELNQTEDACAAYSLAIHSGELSETEQFEAAFYILRAGGDYKLPYTCFLELYRRGFEREEILSILTGVFYRPNEKELRSRYEKNCKLLKKYPYLFRKDFPDFEDLPIRFYPYTDDCYIPFSKADATFGVFLDVQEPKISRNFFKDLEKPVLASDVYSQYELEYLCDNVRKSEYVARENHIYLHYKDWGIFCSYLQCLNFRPLLEEKKVVFLIEEEIAQYPIDFKERFGIDYSSYPLKPIGIREIHRMIWLSQLSSHNGINFFSEVLDAHPNILVAPVIIFQKIEKNIAVIRDGMNNVKSIVDLIRRQQEWPPELLRELYFMKDRTDKDILVALFLATEEYTKDLDVNSRIAPALLFSPHFYNIYYRMEGNEKNETVFYSEQYDKIRDSSIFKDFKYIKTISPIRRPTTSYGASLRYMWRSVQETSDGKSTKSYMSDELSNRILNRSFMVDWQDRLFEDCVAVRFEDGKLNPKATFTALAAFLDIPYTVSMTYCSTLGERDPESKFADEKGFSTDAVYKIYKDYMSDAECYFIEYFLRDMYEFFGYSFQYYDGESMDEEKISKLLDNFTIINGLIKKSLEDLSLDLLSKFSKNGLISTEEERKEVIKNRLAHNRIIRFQLAKLLLRGLHFVNRNGQPLRMMPLLQLDPALLEQPLYH